MKSETIEPFYHKGEVLLGFMNTPEGSDFLSVLLDIREQFKTGGMDKDTDHNQNVFLSFPLILSPYSLFPVERDIAQEVKVEVEGFTQIHQDIESEAKEGMTPKLGQNLNTQSNSQANYPNSSNIMLSNSKDHVIFPQEKLQISSGVFGKLDLSKNTFSNPVVEDVKNEKDVPFIESEYEYKTENTLEIRQGYKPLSEKEPLSLPVKKEGKDNSQKNILEGLIYDKLSQKESYKVPKQETIKTESIEKQTFVKNYEHKAIKVDIEDIKLKFNFLGDRLRLNIVLNEDKYVSPTGYEVQKLVQSLQSLGFNLEAFKLNGNLLYGSDNKNGGKKDERHKTVSNYTNKEIESFKGESFSLYL